MTSAYETGQVPPIQVKHRLRIAREHAGLDQDQLADLIGVSRKTIGNAERGLRPRKITLRAWAFHCGVPLSWIEHGVESPQKLGVVRSGDPENGAPESLLLPRLDSNQEPVDWCYGIYLTDAA